MKLFTSLHDTLHVVTAQIQSGLKRLRRSSPTTSSPRRDSVAQSKPKRPRKHYLWRSHKNTANEKTSTGSSRQRVPQLSGLHFSGVDIARAVTAASFVDPFTETKIQHQIQGRNREVPPSTVAESHGHMKPRLPVEIWAQILDHGIWGGDLSFLLTFRSVSRVFNALSRHQVPRRVPTCLKHDEGDVMSFTPAEIRPGSWTAVEKRLSSSTEYNDFLMLRCDNPGLYSALPLISAASIRRPTSLIIKESPPYGEGHYIAVAINNRIRTQLVHLGLTRSISPDFVGWNKLEEVILECPISIGDAFHLFGQTDCNNSLRAATLNIYDSEYVPDCGLVLFTAMAHLKTLNLMGSLPTMDILVSRFSLPVLRDLTLTILQSQSEEADQMTYRELFVPWSQLKRFVLRDAHTSLSGLCTVLSQCYDLSCFIWGGSLTGQMPTSSSPLSSLQQLTLDGCASDCLTLLRALGISSSRILKLALAHYRSTMCAMLPLQLEELIVHHPVVEADLIRIFDRLSSFLVRGKFAVLSPGPALRLTFPAHSAVVGMKKLSYLCLQANHPIQALLSSLDAPNIVQADIQPLPYHLS